MRNTLLFSISLLATMFVAQAGPPLICHPYAIGDAKSLPWSASTRDWDATDPAYNTQNLANDTLQLLDQSPSVLVRMETLRRAVIYGGKNHSAARALLAQLKERESAKPTANAYFDYGYFLSSMSQIQWLYKEDLAAGVDGYQFVEKALALEPNSAELHFAAALMATVPARTTERNEHLARARTAKNDALLTQNLATHFQ
ncbi:MAG TPA: hypothetical protein VKT81_01020 [Bryobacteraceae bacterium]|nr:hypothetical protein [Bryobacteraceae bacterium]